MEYFKIVAGYMFCHSPQTTGKRGVLRDFRPYELCAEDFPYGIVHVYFMSALSSEFPVGKHYHKRKAEVMIPVSGTITFDLVDPDGRKHQITLSGHSSKALLVRPGTWHQVSSTDGAVLAVLASTPYEGAEDDFEDVPSAS